MVSFACWISLPVLERGAAIRDVFVMQEFSYFLGNGQSLLSMVSELKKRNQRTFKDDCSEARRTTDPRGVFFYGA